MATAALTVAVVGSVFWAKSYQNGVDPDADLRELRSQAINTLDFGAISVTLSARFTYNSSFHPRIFKGNKFAWYSVAIVAVLQVFITYCPGLNSVVFGMGPMNGIQWGITILMMVLVFIIMEVEKMIRRGLKAKGADTDGKLS